jgi:hypothetical protein
VKGRRAALGLGLLYLATRLPGLTALPMFLDESWHISWSMWIAEGKEWDSPWLFGKGLSIFTCALLFPWAGPRSRHRCSMCSARTRSSTTAWC